MYIDAYRMVWIAAAAIILLIFFGGPDTSKNLRVKTKQEKWLEAIKEQTDPKKNKSPLGQYGVTDTGSYGYGGVGNNMGNSGMALSPQFQYGQPGTPLPSQQGGYMAPQGYNQQGYVSPSNNSTFQSQEQQPTGYTPGGQQVLGRPNFQFQPTPSANQPNGTMPYPANQITPQVVPGYVAPTPIPGGAMGQTDTPGVAPQDNPNDITYFPQVFPRWNNGPSSNAGTASGNGQASVDPRFFLRSGQQVFSSGSYVYVLDAGGNAVPMPDGDYIDKDNRSTIKVRDGKRIISN